jgi:regulator of replication initiation timing
MKPTKKLTADFLRKLVAEEVSKFGDMDDVEKRAKDTEETDADEFADSLEKKIDYAKALKVEEGRLRRRLSKVTETRKRLLKSIVESE